MIYRLFTLVSRSELSELHRLDGGSKKFLPAFLDQGSLPSLMRVPWVLSSRHVPSSKACMPSPRSRRWIRRGSRRTLAGGIILVVERLAR
jgi:hypothetical protein